MAYGGATSDMVGAVDTNIPFPSDYANDADVPAILQDRSLAIFNEIVRQVAAAQVTDAEFETLLKKFVVAKGARSTGTTTTIGGAFDGNNPSTSSTDLSVEVTAPAWDGVVIATAYINTTMSAATDVVAALFTTAAGGSGPLSLLAWNEEYNPGRGHYMTFTTIQRFASGAKLSLRAAATSAVGTRTVSTRFLHCVFLRIPNGDLTV